MSDHTPANWPKNKNQIPLFDDSQAFCLVSPEGRDGHALLQQRIDQEQADRDNAQRQQQLKLS